MRLVYPFLAQLLDACPAVDMTARKLQRVHTLVKADAADWVSLGRVVQATAAAMADQIRSV